MLTLKLLLRSRKVWVALASLVATIITEAGWLPGVPPERISEVVMLIGGLAIAVIGGIAYEDRGAFEPERPPAKPEIEDVVR